MPEYDVDATDGVVHIEEALYFIGPLWRRAPGVDPGEGRIDYVSYGLAVDNLLELADGRIGSGLRRNDVPRTLGFGQRHPLLCMLNLGGEGEFDDDAFALLKGGLGQIVVVVNIDDYRDKLDSRVAGDIFG